MDEAGEPQGDDETAILVKSLREHGQLREAAEITEKLAPGETHLMLRKPGAVSGALIEKRKSFI